MDAQGVSKDEAMSSGLVVISNAVTAIPEFIDEKSGLLSGGEDFKDMAESLQKLYMSEQLFTELSENSAKSPVCISASPKLEDTRNIFVLIRGFS